MPEAVPIDRFLDLRCVVDSADEAECRAVAESLGRLIMPHAAIHSVMIEPYPKFPGTTEIYLQMDPSPQLESIFTAIRDRLGDGWGWEQIDRIGGVFSASSVWNKGNGARFTERLVRWAHLDGRWSDEDAATSA